MGYGLVEILEDLSPQELKERLNLQSPIRFDFNREKAREDHPASHVHMLRNECRIPVFAPLSIGHFVKFVFRQFYPEKWKDSVFLQDWPCTRFDRTVTRLQEKQIHLNNLT
jgi:hypothetical protein